MNYLITFSNGAKIITDELWEAIDLSEFGECTGQETQIFIIKNLKQWQEEH